MRNEDGFKMRAISKMKKTQKVGKTKTNAASKVKKSGKVSSQTTFQAPLKVAIGSLSMQLVNILGQDGLVR